MPPVPKRRHSTRRQGKRRAKIRLALPDLIVCPLCGNLKPSHTACHSCRKSSDKTKSSKK